MSHSQIQDILYVKNKLSWVAGGGREVGGWVSEGFTGFDSSSRF